MRKVEYKMIDKLRVLYEESGSGTVARVYPVPFLLTKLDLVPSPATFDIIRTLEKRGFLKKVFRVESPALGGIADFSSLVDIPDEIDDFRTGLSLEVKSENIKVYYVIQQALVK